MRAFDIEVNGRPHHVEVEKVGNRYRIGTGGRTEWVDVARVDERTISLIVDGEVRGSHEAGLLEGREPGELEVYLRTGVLQATIGSARGARARAAEALVGAAETGVVRVTTPMPGRVVKVLVASGDHVSARQGLVVVEAMKMQNELRAPRAGTITEVAVREGDNVGAGRVVAVIG